MTYPDTTSQQGISVDASGTSDTASLSEDGNSPPESDADQEVETDIHSDADWISPAQNRVENNFVDLRWKALSQTGRPLCTGLLDKFAQATEISTFTISVLWTNDIEMAGLNKRFRQNDKTTNILSFPAQEFLPDTQEVEPIFLGDIALGFETVLNEAAANGQPAENHLAHLFLHGLLHLVGYDHQSEAKAEAMEALEIQLLAEMNIPNPYLLKPDPNKEDNDHV